MGEVEGSGGLEKKMRFGAGFWGAYPLGRYIEYSTIAEDWGFDAAWIGDTQLVTPDPERRRGSGAGT